MRLVAGRGAVVEKLAGALMRVVGVFLADMQLPYAPWRRSIGKRLLASECKIGKRVRGWQGDARWEMRCTAGKEMHDGQVDARCSRWWDTQPRARLASGFTIGRRVELALDEQMHDGQTCPGLLLFGWCA